MEDNYLRISGIIEESIVDGPGYRFTIFTQGCPHLCPGCHNPHTHSLGGGYLIQIDELMLKIKENPLLQGVTFSGGEPFLQAKVLSRLADQVHQYGKDLITYSGYTYEYLVANSSVENGWEDLIRAVDYLIDGPFLIEQRSLTTPFRGSRNQRIIDINASQKASAMVINEHV